jgi:hypothetical protein
MKLSGIFLGAFLLANGVILLLRNIGSIEIHIANSELYWAIIFILLGASFLLENRVLKASAAGSAAILLTVVIWSFILNFQPAEFIRESRLSKAHAKHSPYHISEPLNGTVQRAKLNLRHSIGTLTIKDTTSDLAYVESISPLGYKWARKHFADYELLELKPNYDHGRFTLNSSPFTTIKLNAAPTWEIGLDISATPAELDFSKFKVERLHLDAGASSIDLRLGHLADKLEVFIDAAAATIDIELPKDVGCEIYHDSQLGKAHFDGFVRRGSTLRTDNFDTASKKIYLNLDSGVSSIDVRRY